MHVYLTGASGFIGGYVLRELIARGHSVRALSRGRRLSQDDERVNWIEGDVSKPETLAGSVEGCDAVIHLVGILNERPSAGLTFESVHFDGTKNVVDLARRSGIQRFIHMSANGARPTGVSGYQTSKWKAEEYVRAAGFAHHVVFRPAIVFGDPGPQNPEFSKLIATTLVNPFPVLPVPGDGKYQLQPVSIGELASAFVQSLELPEANGQSYCVSGRERVSFNDVLDRIAVALGHSPKAKVHHPLWMVRPAIRAAKFTGKLPITPDQLEMLVEGNTCDSSRFYSDFGVEFRPYTPENLSYLRQYV